MGESRHDSYPGLRPALSAFARVLMTCPAMQAIRPGQWHADHRSRQARRGLQSSGAAAPEGGGGLNVAIRMWRGLAAQLSADVVVSSAPAGHSYLHKADGRHERTGEGDGMKVAVVGLGDVGAMVGRYIRKSCIGVDVISAAVFK
jgi:hypothetical protein